VFVGSPQHGSDHRRLALRDDLRMGSAYAALLELEEAELGARLLVAR
jgi:hypothetical protein